MSTAPTASIVVPTRERPAYLDVALASLAPQAARAGAEIVVIGDGDSRVTAAVAGRHGVRVELLADAPGLNAARNAGVRAARGGLVVFVDDDVEAPEGWLDALLRAVVAHPEDDVFGGPIRARLEGGGPRVCGRDDPPITALDLGREDTEAVFVWGANMAVRAGAFARVGLFEEALGGCGDEEDWQRRYRAAGGRVRYVAAAGLDHRRTAADAELGALARAAFLRGRAARRYDEHKRTAPTIAGELRTVAGCAWHTGRRRCAGGVVMAAHATGRLREAVAAPRAEGR